MMMMMTMLMLTKSSSVYNYCTHYLTIISTATVDAVIIDN
jgi:hypothetical protein